MNDLDILPVLFNSNGYWENPIDESDTRFQELIKGNQCIALFDQNGYDLCPLEHLYAEYNLESKEKDNEEDNEEVGITNHRGRIALMKNWITQKEKLEGYVLNHSMILERKGYRGKALEQLQRIAIANPLVRKLISIRPKWGIDFSLDFVSSSQCFELFHYEWDTFDYCDILVAQENLESLIKRTDFVSASRDLISRKTEWHPLEFFAQSDWKCNYFAVPSERFKMVLWD